jgi:hypothetical protein
MGQDIGMFHFSFVPSTLAANNINDPLMTRAEYVSVVGRIMVNAGTSRLMRFFAIV